MTGTNRAASSNIQHRFQIAAGHGAAQLDVSGPTGIITLIRLAKR